MIVYVLYCMATGKCYVGQTRTDLQTRWQLHVNGYCNVHLKRAIKKYGMDGFERQILVDCESQYQMNVLERLWIAVLRSSNHRFGYNIRPGGTSVHSAGTKRKISRSKLGQSLSSKTRKRISGGMKKYWRRRRNATR